MIISLDTETTGIDLFHGAKPFLVTTCNEKCQIRYWEWPVDPHTREPIIPDGELDQIREYIDSADEIILHNSKFDVHALMTIIPDLKWDWSKTHDTLSAAHVLSSNQPKDLTSLTIRYLSRSIRKLELKMEQYVKEALA